MRRAWEAHGAGWEDAVAELLKSGYMDWSPAFRIVQDHAPLNDTLRLETFTKQSEPFDDQLSRAEITIAKREFAKLVRADPRLAVVTSRIGEFALLLDYGTGAVEILHEKASGDWVRNRGAKWDSTDI